MRIGSKWSGPISALAAIFAVAVLAVSTPSTNAQMGPGPGGGPGHGGWSHWGSDFWRPGWMGGHRWGRGDMPEDMRARMRRHSTYMHVGIPSQYENARSTVEPTPANVAQGGELYAENCASCHGARGMGDGEDARSLTPSPALLAYLIERPVAVDPYLLWTISEGGAEFGTAMPAFKDALTEDQIWKIVAYMRSGFPKVEEKK